MSTATPQHSDHTADWVILAGLGTILLARTFSGMALAAPAGVLCEAAVVLLAGAWVALGLGRGRLRAPRLPLLVPAGLFVLVAFVCVFRASNRYAAWGTFVHFTTCLLVFVMAAALASRPAAAKWLAAALVATAAVVAGFGIDQYFVGMDKTEKLAQDQPMPGRSAAFATNVRGRFHDRRAFSVFDLPNTLAGFLILAFPLACAAAASVPSGRAAWLMRSLLGLAAVSLVVCLVLTFSKAGWLVFAGVACAMLLWMLARGRRQVMRIGLVAAAAFAVLVAAFSFTGALKLPGLQRYAWSASARWGYWQGAWQMLGDHPWLGVGPGNFAEHFFHYKTPTGEETRFAHNDYLQIACETGVLGAAAFAALLALWLWYSWPRRAAKPGRDEPAGMTSLAAAGLLGFGFLTAVAGALHPVLVMLMLPPWIVVAAAVWQSRSQAICAAAFLGAAGALAHSFVDIHLYTQGLSFSIWAAMGLALAQRGTRDYRVDTTPRRAATLAAVLLICVACWPTLIRHARSERASMQAERALARRDWPAYQAYLQAAKIAAPDNAKPRVELSELVLQAVKGSQDPRMRDAALDEAIRFMRSAIAVRPRWAAYWHWLAELYTLRAHGKASRLQDALAAERRAVELYPNQPHYLAALGQIYERLNQPDEAAKHFRKALALDEALRDADGPAHLRLPDKLRVELQLKTSAKPPDAAFGRNRS